jgi:hypothetical protein
MRLLMDRSILTYAAVASVILSFVLFAEASVEYTIAEGRSAAEQPANITWKCILCHAKRICIMSTSNGLDMQVVS